jgi:hypothetical protein
MGVPTRITRTNGNSEAYWDDVPLTSEESKRVKKEFSYIVRTFFLPIDWAIGFDQDGRVISKNRFD